MDIRTNLNRIECKRDREKIEEKKKNTLQTYKKRTTRFINILYTHK